MFAETAARDAARSAARVAWLVTMGAEGRGAFRALEAELRVIKDFCLARHPDDRDKIEKCTLSACINNYVDDARIKDCAARAAWLGNDETHYVRNWVDKDIKDLKTLVRLTVVWIESVLLTDQFRTSMTKDGG